jgi:hypothetical protein
MGDLRSGLGGVRRPPPNGGRPAVRSRRGQETPAERRETCGPGIGGVGRPSPNGGRPAVRASAGSGDPRRRADFAMPERSEGIATFRGRYSSWEPRALNVGRTSTSPTNVPSCGRVEGRGGEKRLASRWEARALDRARPPTLLPSAPLVWGGVMEAKPVGATLESFPGRAVPSGLDGAPAADGAGTTLAGPSGSGPRRCRRGESRGLEAGRRLW